MKPKGLVNKRITKSCPECGNQMPTACKSCSCGFMFKRNVPASVSPPHYDNLTRRRTGRVKKEPQYFNTMEYDHQFKRRRKSGNGPEDLARKKAVKPKATLNKVKEEKLYPSQLLQLQLQTSSCDTQQEEKAKEVVLEDLHGALTKEKNLQYAIVLAELNRKYLGQSFNPS